MKAAVLAPLFALAFVFSMLHAARADDPLDRYNVAWTTPGAASTDSMPIGNGDVGANVWMQSDGKLYLLLSKTDAWSENCRLLKLGRLCVAIEPNPLADGGDFRQTLKLRQGEIVVVAGPEGRAVTLRIWIDANRPVVRVEADGEREFQVTVTLEPWRVEPRRLEGSERHSAYGISSGPDPIICRPDTIVRDDGDAIEWYHRNESSIWADNLRHQGLGELAGKLTDPLMHRTFGARVQGEGLEADGATTLRSTAAAKRFVVSIYPLTAQTPSADVWRQQLGGSAIRADTAPLEKARAEHHAWWNAFWNRSWIRALPAATVDRAEYRGTPLAESRLPLRVGADSDGRTRFVGDVERVLIYDRALTPEEIADHAAGRMPASGEAVGSVADWSFDRPDAETFTSPVGDKLSLGVVGKITAAPGRPDGLQHAIRLDGTGYLQTPHHDSLDLRDAVTMETWIRPGNSNGRIVDKGKVGGAAGFMIDMHPGNSLRLVLADGNMQGNVRLEPGKWAHVVGLFDAVAGRKELYVDGKLVASEPTNPDAGANDPAFVVTRGYTLQRWINACAGRGGSPIKFNGTIFTVDMQFDADYRAWGGPYWWQNTRLPYWPMLACSDFDMMMPMFRMYRATLPLARERSRVWFGHDAPLLPETMYFWGMFTNDNYGWKRDGLHVSQLTNRYIRREYTCSLELLAMMIDYYDFTRDESFLADDLLPMADGLLPFWDVHYERDAKGHIRLEPAQALETLQNAVNPATDVAGLHWVLGKLLKLPEAKAGAKRRELWTRLAGEVPPLAMGEVDGKRFILGAEKIIGGRGNSENPELYAVFPFRLFGVGKPHLEIGRETFARRHVKGNIGWRQDEAQAALLGLTDVAAGYLAHRAGNKHPGSRFPAFWGPNMDWIPDQDHGGNVMIALQAMLMQTEGDRIILLPAWPDDWNVEFKLHAPRQTTVSGFVRNGKVENLIVEPKERAGDVVLGSKLN